MYICKYVKYITFKQKKAIYENIKNIFSYSVNLFYIAAYLFVIFYIEINFFIY